MGQNLPDLTHPHWITLHCPNSEIVLELNVVLTVFQSGASFRCIPLLGENLDLTVMAVARLLMIWLGTRKVMTQDTVRNKSATLPGGESKPWDF